MWIVGNIHEKQFLPESVVRFGAQTSRLRQEYFGFTFFVNNPLQRARHEPHRTERLQQL